MTEPTTNNVGLIVPNTGDLSGTWGSLALNPNFTALDGQLAGVLNIGLSVATSIVLTTGGASLSPGAGPFQSNNALLVFSGTLTGNAVITLAQPGFYIVHNKCTVGNFYVQIAPGGGGNRVGAIPGKKHHVFYDGTDIDYVNQPDPGTAYDLHMAPTGGPPAWFNACTVAPYLFKDGTVYNVSDFPALGAMLGSTFGGNGITTFAVPDELARMRAAYDPESTGRLTGASGVDGATMGSEGGDEFPQSHTHPINISDPGHHHGTNLWRTTGGQQILGGSSPVSINPGNTDNSTTGITASSSSASNFTGASGNLPPMIVSFFAYIKT